MRKSLQLQQLIFERTAELAKYVQKPNANDYFIQKENALLAQLIQIYNESGGSLIHHDLWREVEEAWSHYQKTDSEFCGITLSIRLKPNGILYFLPLIFYKHGI